jgi:DNA (cytosine-5)-methyltransferase 1
MLRVIRLTAPEWVIAENVGGILTWNGGMVFEQVCADLEAAGYDVQPFVIPAVAVNAPHRRDRVWFVGRKVIHDPEGQRRHDGNAQHQRSVAGEINVPSDTDNDVADSRRLRGQPGRSQALQPQGKKPEQPDSQQPGAGYGWDTNWTQVAAELCSLDDGLPAELDGLKLSKPQHRKEQLKAYGNAIVPQVAMQVMEAMKC